MTGITPKQSQLLGFIAAYIAERGCSPSYREMAADIGSNSTGEVARLVNALIDRGHITKDAKARSVSVIDSTIVHSSLRFRSLSRETLARSAA